MTCRREKKSEMDGRRKREERENGESKQKDRIMLKWRWYT